MPHTTAARTETLLAGILADAARMTPQALAETIRDTEWQATGTDTAASAYLATRLALAGHPHVTVWVQHHTVTVLDTPTRTVLARAELTGGIADLHDLITEHHEDFTDLHAGTPDHRGAADHAEAQADPFGDATTDDDPEFFAVITRLRELTA